MLEKSNGLREEDKKRTEICYVHILPIVNATIIYCKCILKKVKKKIKTQNNNILLVLVTEQRNIRKE